MGYNNYAEQNFQKSINWLMDVYETRRDKLWISTDMFYRVTDLMGRAGHVFFRSIEVDRRTDTLKGYYYDDVLRMKVVLYNPAHVLHMSIDVIERDSYDVSYGNFEVCRLKNDDYVVYLLLEKFMEGDEDYLFSFFTGFHGVST